MKKTKNYSSSFTNAMTVIQAVFSSIANQIHAKRYSTGTQAKAFVAGIAPQLITNSREFKLLALRVLIYSKFIGTRTYVTYSFLMKEMRIGYLELIGLLKELGIIDFNNNDPQSDCLVANDGDNIPPKGFFICGNPNREHLTPEEYISYADK